jgi:N-acetylmuramoyl-L-alanine amidase
MRDGTIARRALLGFVAAGLFGARGSIAARRRQPPPHIVAIDPGHGGADPGAISPSRLYEKDITLDTALTLARRLNASGRFRAVLTRRGDVYVPLRNRIMRARARHAELFVPIHADMLPSPDIRGLSVYTLSEAASDRQAAALAARENKDDFTGLKLSRRPPDVGSVLLDLSRHETNNRSLAFAHTGPDCSATRKAAAFGRVRRAGRRGHSVGAGRAWLPVQSRRRTPAGKGRASRAFGRRTYACSRDLLCVQRRCCFGRN